MEPPQNSMEPPPGQASSQHRNTLSKKELAMLISVVSAVVALVQKLLTDQTCLQLLPSQTKALEASLRKTKQAVSKLHITLALASHISELSAMAAEPAENQPELKNDDDNINFVENEAEAEEEEDDDDDDDENDDENAEEAAPTKEKVMETTEKQGSYESLVLTDRQAAPLGGEGRESAGFPEEVNVNVDGSLPEEGNVGVDGRLPEEVKVDVDCSLPEEVGSTADGDDSQWRASFRMGKAAFQRLAELLRPDLDDLKLAAYLYRLAHGTNLAAGNFDGDLLVQEVNAVLQRRLSHLLIRFPSTEEEVRVISERFAVMGLPDCCGTLGCKRFSVSTVAMQAVVDADGRFLDISVGWPDTMLPEDILPQTRLLTLSQEVMQGRSHHLIGGTAYPLLPWLLVPYPTPSPPAQLPGNQVLFNRVHVAVMNSTIGAAFSALDATWRLLHCGSADSATIAAACILHNFLVSAGELHVAGFESPPPEFPSLSDVNQRYGGNAARDAVAAHLWKLLN